MFVQCHYSFVLEEFFPEKKEFNFARVLFFTVFVLVSEVNRLIDPNVGGCTMHHKHV